MAKIQKKVVRKLVSLPMALSEQVERYRERAGVGSDSDALKALIEDGLKLHDTREDLYQRCEEAIASGQTVGDVVDLLASGHPLIAQVTVDSEELNILLKVSGEGDRQRFCLSRMRRAWEWQIEGNHDEWRKLDRRPPPPPPRPGKSDLDDDVPF